MKEDHKLCVISRKDLIQIFEKYLKKKGCNNLSVRGLEFCNDSINVYYTQERRNEQRVKKKNPRSYHNKSIADFGKCGSYIWLVNALAASNINDLYDLEDFLIKQFSECKKKIVLEKILLKKIRNFGKVRFLELIKILELEKLKIQEDGRITSI